MSNEGDVRSKKVANGKKATKNRKVQKLVATHFKLCCVAVSHRMCD